MGCFCFFSPSQKKIGSIPYFLDEGDVPGDPPEDDLDDKEDEDVVGCPPVVPDVKDPVCGFSEEDLGGRVSVKEADDLSPDLEPPDGSRNQDAVALGDLLGEVVRKELAVLSNPAGRGSLVQSGIFNFDIDSGYNSTLHET